MTTKSSVKTTPFGGNGGLEFARQIIKEIGLRTGKYVDQIIINGLKYGESGGTDRGSIIFGDEEYIKKVEIRSCDYVDSVKFTTNEGNQIGGGGGGGSPHTLDNIRVIAIGGRSGKYVDKLNITYIDNYQPSTIHEQDMGFILSFTAPNQEFYEYEKKEESIIDSYDKVTESMLKQTYSASVEGEYYVKVAASTEIRIEDTTLTTVKRELDEKLEQSKCRTTKIDGDHVGILSVSGSLMEGEGGKYYWMFPTSDPSYSIIPITEIRGVLDHYDLTGELSTQMPDLKDHKVIKNGYVYYQSQS